MSSGGKACVLLSALSQGASPLPSLGTRAPAPRVRVTEPRRAGVISQAICRRALGLLQFKGVPNNPKSGLEWREHEEHSSQDHRIPAGRCMCVPRARRQECCRHGAGSTAGTEASAHGKRPSSHSMLRGRVGHASKDDASSIVLATPAAPGGRTFLRAFGTAPEVNMPRK